MIRLRQRSHRGRPSPSHPLTEIVPISAPSIQAECPFCAAPSVEIFRLLVLGRSAAYAECRRCLSLHVVAPDWLAEAYAEPARADALDSGAPWRNGVLAGVLLRLGAVAPVGPWLDYGSGRGLLVADLAARGLAIHGHDPMRGVVAPPGRYAMISSFEVLEHQVSPVAMLREVESMLADDGVVVLSTWLRELAHGPGWRYLAPESGQHVAFASQAGLSFALAAAELRWWCSASSIEHAELQIHLAGRGEPRGHEPVERSGFRIFARA